LGSVLALDFKPAHGMLRIAYGRQSEMQSDDDERSAAPKPTLSLMSLELACATNYAVGQVTDGALHLTPVSRVCGILTYIFNVSTVQIFDMYPDFSDIDAAAIAAKQKLVLERQVTLGIQSSILTFVSIATSRRLKLHRRQFC
jgi:hypothetical protein